METCRTMVNLMDVSKPHTVNMNFDLSDKTNR